jgi:restriction system protein
MTETNPVAAIPDFQSLMLPVLRAARSGEVRVSAVVQGLADDLALSEEARTTLLPSGQQTAFGSRVHWAKTYLARARALQVGSSCILA